FQADSFESCVHHQRLFVMTRDAIARSAHLVHLRRLPARVCGTREYFGLGHTSAERPIALTRQKDRHRNLLRATLFREYEAAQSKTLVSDTSKITPSRQVFKLFRDLKSPESILFRSFQKQETQAS